MERDSKARKEVGKEKRESENKHENLWSLVPLIASQQQVQVIECVCECVIV